MNKAAKKEWWEIVEDAKVDSMLAIDKRTLWLILVPTIRNDGRPIRTRFHRVWDGKVRDISGGLTITPPVSG